MPVVLINENERYKFEFEGSVFYYRRVPSLVKNDIMQKHTKIRMGQQIADYQAVMIEILDYAIIEWENVLDTNNSPVACNYESKKMLPDEVRLAIIDRIDESFSRTSKKQAAEIKNS